MMPDVTQKYPKSCTDNGVFRIVFLLLANFLYAGCLMGAINQRIYCLLYSGRYVLSQEGDPFKFLNWYCKKSGVYARFDSNIAC